MGVPNFEQAAKRLTSVIFGKCQFAEMLRGTDSEAPESCCVDSEGKKARTSRSRGERRRSYAMNKCLSLVHRTSNYVFCEKTNWESLRSCQLEPLVR
jgi:hypothetical protein